MQKKDTSTFWKSLQRDLSRQDYSSLQRHLLLENLPVLPVSPTLTPSLPSEHESVGRIAQLLLRVKTPHDADPLTTYNNLTRELSHSTLFCEEFEFRDLFQSLFGHMKRDLRAKGLLTEDSLADIISALRQIFNALKKSEFYGAVAVCLTTLFYLNFKIRQFHQLTYLLTMVQPFLPRVFAASDRVEALNLHYYVARLSHFGGDLEAVESELDQALGLAFSRNQIRRLLKLAIPVKMNLGRFPTRAMLERFGLPEHARLAETVCQGDLAGFEATVDRNLKGWISSGVYFLLHECKSLLLRNLVKKVYLLRGRPASLDLRLVHAALNMGRTDSFAPDEVIALMSGLIHQDYIRGLVYPEDFVLHLRKLPFPDLNV